MSARFLHERGHVANHQVKLKKKEEIAEGTMAFSFEKPAGFQFKPGQFANLTLLNPSETDAGDNVRTLSIASAPFEEDLMFATRMRDTAEKIGRTGAAERRSTADRS